MKESLSRFERALVATIAVGAVGTAAGGYAVFDALRGSQDETSSAFTPGPMEAPLEPMGGDYDVAISAIKDGLKMKREQAAKKITTIIDPELQSRTRHLEQVAEAYVAFDKLSEGDSENINKVDRAISIIGKIEDPDVKKEAKQNLEQGLVSRVCDLALYSEDRQDLTLAEEVADKIVRPEVSDLAHDIVRYVTGGTKPVDGYVYIDYERACDGVEFSTIDTRDELMYEVSNGYTEINLHSTDYHNTYNQKLHSGEIS